jgi:putative two-component system response regulator
MARILIVDDEENIRQMLGQFLLGDAHEVIEAQDADTALNCLNETLIDVVVADIILPRVTGVELLRRIHATAPHVQVVMMTGEPTVESASESLRAGAADYLFKPIAKATILHVVANAAKLKSLFDTKRRLEEENRAYREDLERLVDERTRQLGASQEHASELSRYNQQVLNALSAHICVLAEDGTILAV